MTDEYHALFNVAGNVFIVWATLVGIASVIVHLYTLDRRSQMSVHLLLYRAAMTTVLILSCIRIFIGDSWWFQLLRLATFIGVPIMMSQWLYLQVRALRKVKPTLAPEPAPDRASADD